jgi:hypothetical protein
MVTAGNVNPKRGRIADFARQCNPADRAGAFSVREITLHYTLGQLIIRGLEHCNSSSFSLIVLCS